MSVTPVRVLALLVLAATAAAAEPTVTDAALTCDARRCIAYVHQEVDRVRACIDGAAIGATGRTAPLVAGADVSHPMTRTGRRWCTTEDVGTKAALVVGRTRRSFEIERVADVELACGPRRCTALVFENVGNVRVCVDGARVGATSKAPALVESKSARRAMTRDGTSWCAIRAMDATSTLVVGKTVRTIEVERFMLALEDELDVPDLEVGTWSPLPPDPLEGELDNDGDGIAMDREDIPEWEPLATVAPKERLPDGELPSKLRPLLRAGKQRLPDDRSFLDVVAVGDATGYHCTGVLVGPRAALTAAHCLPATRIGIGNNVHTLLATVEVKATAVHPELDVAVLHFAAALPIGIRPRADEAPRGIIRMIGFGVDEPVKGGGFGVKRRLDVPVDGWGCDRGRARTAGCTIGAELVAPAVGGRDTCWGDSGGPVLRAVEETFELVAITSRPVARGGAPCGRGGIYVRVDAIRAWLDQQIKESEQ